MIRWDLTTAKLKIARSAVTTKMKVVVECDNCHRQADRVLCSINRSMKAHGGVYLCHDCSTKNERFKAGCSQRAKKKWQEAEYQANNLAVVKSEEYRDKKRAESLIRWQDPAFVAFMMSPEMRSVRSRNSSVAAKKKWQDPEYREKLIKRLRERMLKQWRNEDYSEHMRDIMSERCIRMWQDGCFDSVFDEAFRQKMRSINREIVSRPETLQKLSAASKKNWEDLEYRKVVIDGNIEKWQDPEFRERMVAMRANPPLATLQKLSAASKKSWEDPEYRKAVIDGNIEKWQDPEFRERMAVVRANQPRISSLQLMLYKYLEDIGVAFYREGNETAIGYYSFDCLVPKQNNMRRNLLIECQGDYWHSIAGVAAKDRAKFTYINRYFPEHEIMYLWEREFFTSGRVLDRLKLKLGISVETVDFSFSDLKLRDDLDASEVRDFLNMYHYIGKGRGGITIGAEYNGQLVAVAVFSQPLRQNQGGLYGDFRELSRLCFHPSFHKKNFGSWFLSRVMKYVRDVPVVVAYADATVGHDGGVYRASNFEFSHEVRPDYWYVDRDGFVMHKRTLYGRASKMKMTEGEFADKYGYVKKFGGPKKCFIFSR